MARVINFNPGPSALPLSVLQQMQEELLDYQGTGMSILEHSHRGQPYGEVHTEVKELLRELLTIPASHEILFMTGGATSQFAFVPLNFLHADRSADYIVTGTWSVKAMAEAKIVAEAQCAWEEKQDGKYLRVPVQSELKLDPNAAYCHMTSNNTVAGTQFHYVPDSGSVPLVADMSSDILSRPIDVSKFGLIYAGAQKNLGPSGVTVVIIRKSWIDEAKTEGVPKIFRYKTILEGDSLQNTAPTFPIYAVRNNLRWVKEQGGVSAMEAQNKHKAEALYGCISEIPNFYTCPVEASSRSLMNAVFRLPTEALEKQFVAEASAQGMHGVKGHRSVGGIRISMYNAIGVDKVHTLVKFMREFAKANSRPAANS